MFNVAFLTLAALVAAEGSDAVPIMKRANTIMASRQYRYWPWFQKESKKVETESESGYQIDPDFGYRSYHEVRYVPMAAPFEINYLSPRSSSEFALPPQPLSYIRSSSTWTQPSYKYSLSQHKDLHHHSTLCKRTGPRANFASPPPRGGLMYTPFTLGS